VKWASAISERTAFDDAIAEAAGALHAELEGAQPDLVVAFVSPHHAAAFRELPKRVQLHFPRALLIGCAAGGVIGAGHEVEAAPALSLTCASLPGVTLKPVHLAPEAMPEEPSGPAWRAALGADPDADPQLLVLADPYTCDAPGMIAGLDRAYPSGRKVGGLASGGRAPGSNALFLGRDVLRAGAVCVAMTGNLAVDTIVAQGCRPIGKPMLVTRCRDHSIEELDRRPPVEVLRELFDTLDERDQSLFRHSLFLGLEMNQGQVEYHAGEHLVRNIVGMDPSTGAISVGARCQPWKVVQFLLRDARTAAEDLAAMLERYRVRAAAPEIKGALLFSCLGRGQHLYGRADHDTEMFRARLGPVPLGGFFCNGEIGPVGGITFLHGYTSAFGLFREKQETMPR
jgi:small ligand-binding sensory domain FIST